LKKKTIERKTVTKKQNERDQGGGGTLAIGEKVCTRGYKEG